MSTYCEPVCREELWVSLVQTSIMADEKFERVMKVTQKEMADAKLPLTGRDYCAHLLIPLLKCRKETYFVPWKCHHEKHLWERCEYDDFMYRVKEKERRKLDLAEK